MEKQNLVGVRFEKLTVINKSGNKNKNTAWTCRCDCGNERSYLTYNLVSGKSTSCGCKRKITLSIVSKTHGFSKTRLYQIYKGMKQRCYNKNNPAYKYYGGKGIIIYKKWLDDFKIFREWALKNNYTDELSIDRIKPNKGYEPNNCRWINMQMQQNNKLNSMFLKIGNKKHTIAEWANINNTNKQTLYSKFYRLMSQLNLINVDVLEVEIKLKMN